MNITTDPILQEQQERAEREIERLNSLIVDQANTLLIGEEQLRNTYAELAAWQDIQERLA